MKKRGIARKSQFYILAAIIIITIIVSIAVISNYAKPRKRITKIYDLGGELNIETGNVYSYGIYNKNLTNDLIENWTNEYYKYSRGVGGIENWIFIYGDEKEVTVLYFTTNTTGKICIVGSNVCVEPIGTYPGKETIYPSEGQEIIKIEFRGISYEFEIKKNEENFFFVISSAEEVTKG